MLVFREKFNYFFCILIFYSFKSPEATIINFSSKYYVYSFIWYQNNLNIFKIDRSVAKKCNWYQIEKMLICDTWCKTLSISLRMRAKFCVLEADLYSNEQKKSFFSTQVRKVDSIFKIQDGLLCCRRGNLRKYHDVIIMNYTPRN